MKRTFLTMLLCLLFFTSVNNYGNVKANTTELKKEKLMYNSIKYINDKNSLAKEFNIYLKSNNIIGYRISKYDSLIKYYSKDINWDWRLVASLIYQESRFNPNIKSPAGAYGLMQMMPSTQKYFNIDTTVSPEKQIEAGVKYIKFLDNIFINIVHNRNERIKFILASYNIGAGHIYDAQRLAIKQQKNPNKWFNNVEQSLLSKSKPENYNDTINVRNGYCSGIETFNFVHDIMNRYEMFKKYYK